MTARPEPARPWRSGDEPIERDAVPLRRINRWQVEQLREDLADLYVESARAAPGQEYQSREDFLARLAADVRHRGFDMVLAERGVLVGFACGFPVSREGTWWRGIEPSLPQDIEQLTASGHVLAITEIVVHPSEQHHGLAGRLQARLFADHEASLGAARLDRTDQVALTAFTSWGWREIGTIRRPQGSAVLRVLVYPIGARGAHGSDGLVHNPRTQRPERSADA